jgi:hypothetical protein
VRAEVTEKPGLQGLLSETHRAPDEALAPAVEDFLATPGVAHSPVAAGLEEAIERDAERPAEGLESMLEAIRRWLDGEQHEVVGTEEQVVELEAYWLTVPDVPEASVTLASAESSSEENSARVDPPHPGCP